MEVGEPFSPYRVFTGVFIPDSLLAYQGITANEKLCLARLFKYAGRRKYCFPEQDELAESLGVSVRTIREYLSALERDGFIRSERVGFGQSNRYWMLRHEVFFAADGPDEEEVEMPSDSGSQSGRNLPIKSGTTGSDQERNHGFRSIRANVLMNHNTRITTGTTTEDPCQMSFEDFLHAWSRHRGFKKPNKTQRETAEHRWSAMAVSEEQVTEALEWYFGSEEARKNHYPILPLVKALGSWRSGLAETPRRTVPLPSDPPDEQTASAVANVQQEPSLPQEILDWNEHCVAAAKVELWESDSDEHRNLLRLRSKPKFVDNHITAMKHNQELILKFGEQKPYLRSISWFLKGNNWMQLIQGKHDFVLNGSSSRATVAEDVAKRAIQKVRSEHGTK